MIHLYTDRDIHVLPSPDGLSEDEYLDKLIEDPTRTTKTPWRASRPSRTYETRRYVNILNGFVLALS